MLLAKTMDEVRKFLDSLLVTEAADEFEAAETLSEFDEQNSPDYEIHFFGKQGSAWDIFLAEGIDGIEVFGYCNGVARI